MKIIKIPFSGGGLGKGNGANLAPDIVVKENCDSVEVDELNIEESHKKIEEKISNLNEKAIIIGGDHSITYPCVKGFAKEIMLVVLDAHPDLMDNFKPPTHEDYLRVLIEEGIVKPENVILIGIRKWDKIEMDYIKEKKIKYYTCDEIREEGVMEKVILMCKKPVYLSIDIDCIDPSEAIGTGYPEENGLSSEEVISIINKLKDKVEMCDIVEINPKKDVDNMTSKLGAKLVKELSKDF